MRRKEGGEDRSDRVWGNKKWWDEVKWDQMRDDDVMGDNRILAENKGKDRRADEMRL